MAKKDDVSGRGRFLQLGGLVGKDFARRAVFSRSLERLSVLGFLGMK
jgi:hypothetical protein